MAIYVTFGPDGLVTGSYPEDVFPPSPVYGEPPAATDEAPEPAAPVVGEARNAAIPADAVALAPDVWADLMQNQGLRKWDGHGVVIVGPIVPAAITRVFKLDIWRRATDAEAEQLVALLASQPVRLQRMFNDAAVISSADDMWPVLKGGITQAVGGERAAALLAPSA